jgi:predicted flavoprotein YhiN
LLRECAPDLQSATPEQLAASIKALPVKVVRPRPIAEAISSAGGVTWDGIDASYMLTALPGVLPLKSLDADRRLPLTACRPPRPPPVA